MVYTVQKRMVFGGNLSDFQGWKVWPQCGVRGVVYVADIHDLDIGVLLTQKLLDYSPSKAQLHFHSALEGHIPIRHGHLKGSRRAIAFACYFQKCHS